MAAANLIQSENKRFSVHNGLVNCKRKQPILIASSFAGVAGGSKSRVDGEDEDAESCCSTCSSSSSSDEAAAYALPPRRAYGGVRISYVPNDAVACARKRGPTSSGSSNQAQKDTEKCIVS